jgi:Flp pilus assembly protein TadD
MLSNSHKYISILFISGILLLSGCSTTSLRPTDEALNEKSKYDQFLSSDKDQVVDPAKLKLEKLADSASAHKKADIALQEGDLDRALFYFVKAMQINPKDTKALYLIGEIHASKANYALSNAAFSLLLKIDPDHTPSLEGLGKNLVKLNAYTQAQKVFNNVLIIDDQSTAALTGLAIIADLRQDFDWAKQYYTRALKINPNSPKLMNNYAYSRFLANDWDTAEKFYKKLSRMYPKYGPGQLNYALLMARQGKAKEALTTFSNVLTKSQAYNEVGYIYFLEKKYQEAKQLFQLAISSSPSYFDKAVENLEMVNSTLDNHEIISNYISDKPLTAN